MVMELLRAGEVHEDDDTYISPLDVLFNRLESKNSEHIALKYYRDYHSGSAKTLKSIQITLASRLEKFNLESLASLTITDELDLPSLGEKKVALFALIPDNDTSFNFLVSILTIEVKGATPGNQHWVAITGVNENNVNIVDPGSNGTDLWSSYEWSKSSQFNYFMVN